MWVGGAAGDETGAAGELGGGGGGGGGDVACVGLGLGFFVGFGFFVGLGFGAMLGIGAWLLSGGVPVTYAGGGNCLIGSPSMSACITAFHVRAG